MKAILFVIIFLIGCAPTMIIPEDYTLKIVKDAPDGCSSLGQLNIEKTQMFLESVKTSALDEMKKVGYLNKATHVQLIESSAGKDAWNAPTFSMIVEYYFCETI